jgi:cupin fold WbuC family metalloprotein
MKRTHDSVIRISSAATQSVYDSVCRITASLVAQKAADASINGRQRETHMFHADGGELVQRMLNAVQPSSYGRPHCHSSPPKSETLLLLKGSLGFVSFSEEGIALDSDFILLSTDTGNIGLDCRAGVWHTFFALEPDTVVFEVKPGPFDAATDKDPASWAPPENTLEGLRYLRDLEDRFRMHLRLAARAWHCPSDLTQ